MRPCPQAGGICASCGPDGTSGLVKKLRPELPQFRRFQSNL